MHLVASIRPASDLEAAVEALVASAAMTKAEARMRLAPEPPALLVRLPPEDAVRVVTELGRAGLPALALDEDVPSDSERFQVRSFAFEAGPDSSPPGPGRRSPCRGTTSGWCCAACERPAPPPSTPRHGRSSRRAGGADRRPGVHQEDHLDRPERPGGLRAVHPPPHRCAAVDPRRAGARVLRPRSLLQPARTANLGVLTQELRRRAPRAFHDDRLLRLGRRTLPFVLGGNEQRSNTRGSVDVLAAVLDQAVRTGLLP